MQIARSKTFVGLALLCVVSHLTLCNDDCCLETDLRIVSPDGHQIITGTGQLTGGHKLQEVKQVLREALEDLGEDVPRSLLS